MPSPRPRKQQANSWMQGFTTTPSLEAHCQALEARLNEGQPRLFADEPRVHLEPEWWAL